MITTLARKKNSLKQTLVLGGHQLLNIPTNIQSFEAFSQQPGADIRGPKMILGWYVAGLDQCCVGSDF
jgi:hypothetical protein